jgi:catechol 2,3-dioxygenase-like lactoylglutathione lyase family enzyme
MTEDRGSPPRTGWAKLVPELLVSDIASSTAFWRDRLGFAIAYQRPEQSFVYLERPEGAQLMLCQRSGNWETASLHPPFGRGAMFQVYMSRYSGRSKSGAGLSMPARARSGARSVIGRRDNAKSLFRTRTDI